MQSNRAIKPIQPDQLQQLLDLYQHLHRKDEPLPADLILQETWDQILAMPGHHPLGLYIDERLVSSCILIIVPNLTRGCRPYGLIANVVTHADYRGRGLGKQTLRHTLDVAWKQNCYKVMLMTGRKDETVFRFYESVGFNQDEKQAFIAKPNRQKDS
ncbi:MAG: GNAT family N-acetyltransferase [Chloroflexota bacterium]